MKKLVTFTATWCGPCKMLKPILQKLHDDKLIVWENYDIDEERALARQKGVKSVPTLFFYDEEGNITHQSSGFISKDKILALYGEVEVEPEPTVSDIIESSEHVVVDDEVVEVEENIVLTPPAIDLEAEVEPMFVDESEVYDDEFTDEDLGNDLPKTIDPDNLF